jgi:hypothetical protein
MESTTSIWKSCLKYGLIMGLISIVMSVLIYMLDLTFATWIIIPNIIVSIVVLFLLQRSYRDAYENGYISYGKSLGAGMIILVYAAIIVAVYTYLLYKVIDPGLIDKTIAASTAKLEAKGMPESAIDAATKMQAKMLKPAIISLTQVFSTLFMGFLMSLVTSIFISKKGNPLTENE